VDVDDKVAKLKRQIAHREHALGILALQEPPRYLTTKLGPPPRSYSGHERWATVAGRIEAHREQFGITDPRRALGAKRGQAREQRARAQLEDEIALARRSLDRSDLHRKRALGIER